MHSRRARPHTAAADAIYDTPSGGRWHQCATARSAICRAVSASARALALRVANRNPMPVRNTPFAPQPISPYQNSLLPAEMPNPVISNTH